MNLLRILGWGTPASPRDIAQQRLEQIVEATRNSYEVRRYREKRAAALRGRA